MSSILNRLMLAALLMLIGGLSPVWAGWLAVNEMGQRPGIVINEVLARNDQTNADSQEQYNDWIELYNTGNTSVDVGGLFLSDHEDQPTLWQIPTDRPESTLMAPGDTLLIWADGDVNAPGLHAPFALDAEHGESLWLFSSDGTTLLDTVTFGPQVPDVAWGRVSDGADEWTTLSPTPDGSNDGHSLSVVGEVQFSQERGFYQEPFSIALTTNTSGAVIFYTLDGSTPTPQHGHVYTGPIPIDTTTCLRAMAAKANDWPAKVDTQTYLFINDIIHQATDPVTGHQVVPVGWPASWGGISGDYQMDPDVIGQEGQDLYNGRYSRGIAAALQAVPTLSLVMDVNDWCGPQGIYIHKNQDGTERVCSFEFFDPCDGMSVQGNCALAMQGGVSGGGTSLDRNKNGWKTPKLSLRPRFKAQTDDGQLTHGPTTLDAALFPDSPVKKLNTVVIDAVLNNAWLHPHQDQRDRAMYVQDQYVADLHNALGGYSPHGRYVHLYLNGVHFTSGITFTFDALDLAPGQVTLIVADTNAFTSVYGPNLPVAGVYTGKLSNSGERITLVDALGKTIQSFSYADDWYKITDGDGYSLVAVDPAHTDPNDLSRSDAWMPSLDFGGSPGQ